MNALTFRSTGIVLLVGWLSFALRDSASASLCATPSFVSGGTFRAGTQPVSVSVGDFNGDSRLDLAVANQFSANISILLGRGDGTFLSAVHYSAGFGPASATVWDVNADGRLDLIATDVGTTNVWVLLGNANGTFQPAVSSPVPNISHAVTVADFNGDTRPDLAVAIRVDGAISVLTGNGNGTFETTASYDSSPDPYSIAMGDFDGDGVRDLAVADAALFEEPPRVSVLLGRANGTFRLAVYYDAGTSPRSIAVGDFNEDNRLDLAVANYGSFVGSVFTNSSISMMFGNGNGTFQPAVNSQAGEAPLSLVAADLNDDGHEDLAIANQRSRNVSVRFGNGDGTLRTPANYAAGFNPRWIEKGDFNGDSQLDLAVVNDGGVLILLGTCVTSADLAITRLNSSGPVPLGSNLVYTVGVTNNGPDPAADVTLVDLLPSNVNFVSATSSQGGCAQSAGTVTCGLGSLANATAATITITVSTIAVGSLTNMATVTSSTDDPNPSNNNASVVTAALPFVDIVAIDSSASESGPDPGQYSVRRVGGTAGALTVTYTVTGTATSGSDFVALPGSVTIANGSASATISLIPVNDAAVEPTESVTLVLSPQSGYTIDMSSDRATVNVLDNDVPALSIDDATVVEGNAGTVNAAFIVRLTPASFQTVTVSFATANGTATSGTDYTAASGLVTFAPGTTTQTVNVAVLGDGQVEPNETFMVVLSNPNSATLADAQALGTITNDDTISANLSIGDVSVTEGQSGTTNAVFLISLSPASTETVTVNFATANGTAVSSGDYIPTNGTVTFTPGTTSRSVIVRVNGDALNEADETFLVALSNPSNAALVDGQALGTIVNDDPLPGLSIGDVSVTEGQSGTTNAVFTVTLSDASGRTVTVNFASANGTAEAGSDYTATNGMLTFAPGTTTLSIPVRVFGDVVSEGNETFTLNLSAPAQAVLTDGSGTGTIVNDDVPLPGLSISDATVAEGNAGRVNALFTISLSSASAQTVTCAFSTADGTAEAGSDYVATNGVVTLAPGATMQTLAIAVNGDTLLEPNETFFVQLSNPSQASLADGQGTATITNDDAPPALAIEDAMVTEGDSGTTGAVFNVRLLTQSGQTVTVGFATADGTAIAGVDYTATNGTLNFPAGTAVRTVVVPIRGDRVNEGNEMFFVRLNNPANATISDGEGVGTILNDDPIASISIANAVVFEGNSGSINAAFLVTLSAASEQVVTVNYETTRGTTSPNDFQNASGTLRFDPGQTNQMILVQVSGDTRPEDNETFFVNLSGPVNATLANSQATGTILNDEGIPSISITDASVTEGHTGFSNAVFTVRLTDTYAQEVTLSYATLDGTAVAGADYLATNGVVRFAPGTTTQTVAVRVLGDRRNELNETFFVNLSSSTNGLIADSQGLGTITNDDPVPALLIQDAVVVEGNAGETTAMLEVTLSAASGREVSVQFATANDTALANVDYAPLNGTLMFPEGTTNQIVAVTVFGDIFNETDERFSVQLSGPVNATLGDALGVGVIANDDPLPELSVGDVALNEGNSGTVQAVFTVRLTPPSGRMVTVDFGTLDGTARAGSDYVMTNGSLSFAPGESMRTVAVTVTGDVLNEANEAFSLNLASPVNAVFGDSQATGTITNDDPLPTLTIRDVEVLESNTGSTNAVFEVNLSSVSGQTVMVNFTTANSTATAGSDYVATNGTMNFAPGTTSMFVTVTVHNDILNEADERFFVNLSAPVNAVITLGQGLGAILNDDPLPVLSIADVMAAEGNTGTTNFLFTARLLAASGQTVTVNYATADGTARAGLDYVSASGVLTFPTGTTTQTVVIPILGETLNETDETLFVNLSAPVNAILPDNQGLVTIRNDDPVPTLSINNPMVIEGNSGNSSVNFTVSLSAASGRTVTVNYATADGTAAAGTDYVAASGTLTFDPGTVTRTIPIAVSGDILFEANETILVNLSNPVDATLADDQGVATISNDDAFPQLVVDNVSVAEGNTGTINAQVTVRLLTLSGQTVTVNYATSNGLAVAGVDYVPAAGTLVLPAGTAMGTVAVPILGDLLNESNETFFVNLASPVNATIGDGQGLVTISNDDPVVAISIGNAVVFEGDSGTANAVFQVNLSAVSGQVVTVDYATARGTTAGNDYQNASGTIQFNAGQTNQTIIVQVTGDNRPEDNETFFVDLSAPFHATLANSRGIGTILNDEGVPSISIGNANTVEGDSGTANAVFTVNLSESHSDPVTLGFMTADGTATAGADYAATNGVLSFAPGTTSQTIVVRVNGDVLSELNETYFVNLFGSTNAVINDSQGAGTIQDDDPATIVLSTNSVRVTEGGVSTFTVRLIASTTTNVPVTVARSSGSSDLRVNSGASLTFTPANWNIAQTVTLAAVEDENTTDEGAVFTILALGSSQVVNAAGLDNDLQHLTRCAGDSALFSTMPSGAGPFSYLWRRNGQILTGQTNQSLNLVNVTPAEAGTYTVQVSSPSYSVTKTGSLTISGDCLRITSIELVGSDVRVGFTTLVNQTYRVERASDLTGSSWAPVGNQVPGTGGIVLVTDVGGASQPSRFYRVALVFAGAAVLP